MKIYLFDVDGTLTKPRQPMLPAFARFFEEFCKTNVVFLVSGSDIDKIREQVPNHVLRHCYGIFACSGAELYVFSRCMYSKSHVFPTSLIDLCKSFVGDSKYPERAGNHIEHRPGMLNVSAIGRNATSAQRSEYFAWDKTAGERKAFAEMINSMDLGYETSCGGEISIDIVPKGWNKSVVKNEVLKRFPKGNLIFLGDRISDGGNDYPLAQALDDGTGLHHSYKVDSYLDTWKILTHEVGTSRYSNVA
ncbi:MAG: HAD-IIB family hydrolase [Pseudomonadota bacterium]